GPRSRAVDEQGKWIYRVPLAEVVLFPHVHPEMQVRGRGGGVTVVPNVAQQVACRHGLPLHQVLGDVLQVRVVVPHAAVAHDGDGQPAQRQVGDAVDVAGSGGDHGGPAGGEDVDTLVGPIPAGGAERLRHLAHA